VASEVGQVRPSGYQGWFSVESSWLRFIQPAPGNPTFSFTNEPRIFYLCDTAVTDPAAVIVMSLSMPPLSLAVVVGAARPSGSLASQGNRSLSGAARRMLRSNAQNQRMNGVRPVRKFDRRISKHLLPVPRRKFQPLDKFSVEREQIFVKRCLGGRPFLGWAVNASAYANIWRRVTQPQFHMEYRSHDM